MLSLTRSLFPALASARSFSSTRAWANAAAASKPESANAAPSGLSEGEQHIYNRLTERFSPTQLQVQDVSGGCGTFYAIVIGSGAFKGLPMVKQHKLVTETLKSEIEGIHGLQIKTIAQ